MQVPGLLIGFRGMLAVDCIVLAGQPHSAAVLSPGASLLLHAQVVVLSARPPVPEDMPEDYVLLMKR